MSTILKQGAVPQKTGVQYTTWAPDRQVAVVIVNSTGDTLRRIPLQPLAGGFWQGIDDQGRAGDWYFYDFPERGHVPDIASRFQPRGVEGPSEVVNTAEYSWRHSGLGNLTSEALVIYELHIGTFTPEGTFSAAQEKLPYLRQLGVTAIEVMPVNGFTGERNWGYDGVMPFAPARCYGAPRDFQAFIDAAHGARLAVVLDVVYNHIGPVGNWFDVFSSHYFISPDHTMWGAGINFDRDHSSAVRDFFVSNVEMWFDDYRMDGLRLDSIQSISDESPRHILVDMAAAAHARGRFIIGEDNRNLAPVVKSNGHEGLDAVWVDDFHHILRVLFTGESGGYFKSYQGTLSEVVETLNHGWFYRGQECPRRNKKWGSPGDHLPPQAFVHCISNHDQVGNRPLGERLHHTVSMAAYRAASTLICLTPYTPLLFMGQEWAASTPFYFFSDLPPEIGNTLKEAREREFRGNGFNYDRATLEQMPDPQKPETFHASKLCWSELDEATHRGVLKLYQECLQLRKKLSPKSRRRGNYQAFLIGEQLLGLHFDLAPDHYILLCAFQRGIEADLRESQQWDWENVTLVLSSNAISFGGDGRSAFHAGKTKLTFHEPEALLCRIVSERS